LYFFNTDDNLETHKLINKLMEKAEIPTESHENRENQGKLYAFPDGRFRFFYSIVDNQMAIFRVREDITPSIRAEQKGIPRGSSIMPANEEQVQTWLDGHPDYKIIE